MSEEPLDPKDFNSNTDQDNQTNGDNLNDNNPDTITASFQNTGEKKELPRPQTDKIPAKTKDLFRKPKDKNQEIINEFKDFIDIKIKLEAEIARKEYSLRDILTWQNGSVVAFDKIIGENVEIVIGQNLLARGEIVVINDHYGVKITEISHANESIN